MLSEKASNTATRIREKQSRQKEDSLRRAAKELLGKCRHRMGNSLTPAQSSLGKVERGRGKGGSKPTGSRSQESRPGNLYRGQKNIGRALLDQVKAALIQHPVTHSGHLDATGQSIHRRRRQMALSCLLLSCN